MPCSSCYHYATETLSGGECRRYPPRWIYDTARSSAGWFWPYVEPEEGCGEWRWSGVLLPRAPREPWYQRLKKALLTW